MSTLFDENRFESEIDSKVKTIVKNEILTTNYYSAKVIRKDSEGIWWVRLDGNDEETPVLVNKVDMSVGDMVTVMVRDHQTFVDGNLTSPPMSAANSQAYVNTVVARNIKAVTADIGFLKADVATIGYAQIEDADITNARIQNLVTQYTSLEGSFNVLEANALTANSAVITNLQAETAKIEDLTAEQLEATVGYIEDLTAGSIQAADIIADHADISDLEADNASIKGRLTAAEGNITNLTAADATITGRLTAAEGNITSLTAADATITGRLDAAEATISNLDATYATIDVLESDYITASTIESNYTKTDFSNTTVSWIQNGTIKNAAITNEMVQDISANKLTAGTINGSVINVTNLNADNITTGTINGQRIGTGSLSLDKLSEDVYTEAEVDSIVDGLNDRIDGAIESHTGDAVPTLQNSPASSWNTVALKDEHVGDVYYVVNSNIPQNGYCYRFTKSGTGASATYSWQLIKDSDVTAALSRLQTAEGKIGDIEAFDVTMSTFKTNTESAISTLQTKTTDLETSLGDKVSTSTFNELSQTVDGNSSTITSLGTVLTNNGLTTSTNISNTVNSVQQTANANSASITSLTTTTQQLSSDLDDLESSVTTLSTTTTNKFNTVDQTLDGIETSIGNIEDTLETKADGSTVSSLSSQVNTISDTVDGHTQTIQSVQQTLSTKADGSTVSNLSTDYATYKQTTTESLTQIGNRMQTAEGKISTAETNIASNASAIALKASQSDVDTLTGRVSTAESTITQHATDIEAKVSKNGVIAAINLSTETEGGSTAKISADKVNITGTAVFNAINNDTGQTKIDGGKIDATSITIGASTLPEAVLRYDVTYSYDEDPTTHEKVSVTFTAHLYQGATDIKASYPESCFTWSLKSENWIQGEPMSPLTSNGDYTCTVLLDDVGYGAVVVGRFEPPNDAIAFDDDDNTLVDDDDVPISVRVPSGDYVRIADLEVAATVFNADKMLVVTSEGEKLATVSTLKAVFGTSSYNDLTNRPQIEGVTLTGDKSFSDLGIFMTDSQGYSVPDDYTLTTMEINALWANAAPIGA